MSSKCRRPMTMLISPRSPARRSPCTTSGSWPKSDEGKPMLQTAPNPQSRTTDMLPKIRIGVLGASGYTGADLVRLALCHPAMEITVLTANTHPAEKPMAEVFPHLGFVDLPGLTTIEEADWGTVDAVFCGLPHG